MQYGNNILKTESAYYELHNASISNNILTLKPGGSAKCNITEQMLAKATEYFRVNLILDHYTDNYNPQTQVNIHFVPEKGDVRYNDTLYPTECKNGIYSMDLDLVSGDYKEFTFEITAKEQISFLVWELCPEAADEDIKTIIEGVEQSLPRLLYDYNTWPLSVQQNEKTISLITFRLLDHTDLQGHFQLTYVASEACTLTLRFKDNGATELFSPILYDLRAGRGSVGVPHAYLERLTGIHSVIVTAQVSSGTLAINTRGILFTIDGGYLAERMLDIGVDMQDISMRQLSEDYGPDEIWIVGIEAGEAIVRSRKYDPKATIGFTPQYSLGPAQRAAIEFDGDWILRSGNELFTLETEEEPWAFWIDPDDDMYAQHGIEGDAILLDKNVSDLYACKGYSSTTYLEQDQGLVVAYIKNGKVYYKQYAYNTIAQEKRWSDAFELDSNISGAQSISVARLNDYRLAFTVSLPEITKSYITDRTYVNQAIRPEFLYSSNMENIALLYCPPDTDISVHAAAHTENNGLLIVIDIDRPLKLFTYDIQEMLTFDDSIPYEIIKGIKWENNADSTATIRITLKKNPLQLMSKIILNNYLSGDLQCIIGQWGSVICPKFEIIVDNTVYLRQLYTETLRSNIKAIFNYYPVKQTQLPDVYKEVMNTQITSELSYKEVIKRNHTSPNEDMRSNITCALVYSQIGSTPI